MKTKHVLITGSAGLVGSEAVRFYSQKGYVVHGIDNNMRKYFSDPTAIRASYKRLLSKHIRSISIMPLISVTNGHC